MTGRPDQAVTLLEQAEARLPRPELRYYAALFLGRAREASTQMEAARAAYERAMALFPQAQSPRLALAHMAWRGGNESLALSGTRTMFITAGGTRAVDPWWNYDVSLVADWPQQVAALRRAAAFMVGR